MRCFRLCAVLAAVLCAGAAELLAQSALVPVNDLGVRVARGFRVSLYADSDLAHDVYAMTLDARGNVVVTSRGSIRRLLDTNGDGRADTSQEVARTATGGMGMCFDGNDLYFVGDGFFSVYRDANGDGVADSAPHQIMALSFAEHGGHAPRKGPDGWWYVIGGNDAKIGPGHITIPASPVRKPEAGALVRIWPESRRAEVIAHGFRNPYDFDFNWMGDIFTYDSDTERDYFLPWYMPTRIYHVAHGGHHGWRLQGYQRSWCWPEYYVDSIETMSRVGRGSPTGVTSYRHLQFPAPYRGGLFFCDWTFGRVHFLPVDVNGASYSSRTPETFLEPIGNQGFAPTDVAVAPDGSLFVSIGGRGTRGGVYRVEYAPPGGRPLLPTNWMVAPSNSVDAVLAAPQPMDAWSRSWWVPRARQLGAERFVEVATNERLAPGTRVRAIEILTELFNGLSVETARSVARTGSPFVRARVAWSLGRLANRQFAPVISALANDKDPLVRRCALEALLDRVPDIAADVIVQSARPSLVHPDRRVQQVAARIISHLPEEAWQQFWRDIQRADLQTRQSATLALSWRGPDSRRQVLESAVSLLKQSSWPDAQLQSLRLAVLGLGDWNLERPSVEVFAGYEPAAPSSEVRDLAQELAQASIRLLPSRNPAVDMEAARVLAMVRSHLPDARKKVAAFLTDQSSATSDFHYLIAFARLTSPRQTNLTARIAHAVVSLDRKLAGQQQRIKQTWNTRLAELVEQLVAGDFALGDAILRHPQFVKPAHVGLVKSLGRDRTLPAARMFARAAFRDRNFEWSGSLIELLSVLPYKEVAGLFRQQWENVALRDDLIIKLAEDPDPADRDRFLVTLNSSHPAAARAAVRALAQLPPDTAGRGITAGMRLLRRLMSEPREGALRQEVVHLLNHESGAHFSIAEQGTDADALKRAYQPVFDWFARKHPEALARLNPGEEDNPAQWDLLLRSVVWKNGNAANGQRVFQQRGCQTCHGGSTALGPDLGSAAARFSPLDLFYAIVFPNRDVAPAYRTTTFHTRDGQSHTGVVIFESADGYIIQTGATTTVRLAMEQIVSRQPSTLSLMPSGLVQGLQTTELADLYQFLKTLPARN